MEEEGKIILYTTPDGKSRVSLMSRDGRVWLNQKQMAELLAVSKPNVSMLIAKILKEKELDDSVVKRYLTTAADGKKYKVIYYALEMILAVGFRVRGVRGTSCSLPRQDTRRRSWSLDAIVNAANLVMLGGADHPELEVIFCCFSARDTKIYSDLIAS